MSLKSVRKLLTATVCNAATIYNIKGLKKEVIKSAVTAKKHPLSMPGMRHKISFPLNDTNHMLADLTTVIFSLSSLSLEDHLPHTHTHTHTRTQTCQ